MFSLYSGTTFCALRGKMHRYSQLPSRYSQVCEEIEGRSVSETRRLVDSYPFTTGGEARTTLAFEHITRLKRCSEILLHLHEHVETAHGVTRKLTMYLPGFMSAAGAAIHETGCPDQVSLPILCPIQYLNLVECG